MYVSELQVQAFNRTLDARIEYFDQEGTDDILNAIITQTLYRGSGPQQSHRIPRTVVPFAGVPHCGAGDCPEIDRGYRFVSCWDHCPFRRFVGSGYDLGEKVAEGNECRQAAAQGGTQDIRDIRFGIADELFQDFIEVVDLYTQARIRQRRNQVALNRFYKLVVAVSVFVLIYIAFTFLNLELSSLGLFLFAMFRLGPQVSQLNEIYYQAENYAPHLVRNKQFLDGVEEQKEVTGGERDAPASVQTLKFEDVWFAYKKEYALKGVDFVVGKRGDSSLSPVRQGWVSRPSSR
jgi:subfamily B ATP-binding cassette protein MsbA